MSIYQFIYHIKFYEAISEYISSYNMYTHIQYTDLKIRIVFIILIHIHLCKINYCKIFKNNF